MKPIFWILDIPISSYYLFVISGISLALLFYFWVSRKFKLPPKTTTDIAFIVVVSALLGGRFFHVIFELPGYYIKHILEIFAFWKGGMVFYGAVITAFINVYLYFRKKHLEKFFYRFTDAIFISFPLGSFIGRWGCFFHGCCYGKPAYDLPWAVVFPKGGIPPGGIPLHPTQIYMSLYNLLIFGILFIFLRIFYLNKKIIPLYKEVIINETTSIVKEVHISPENKKIPWGLLTYSYLILYGIFRSIVEYYRADFRGDLFKPYLSTSQAISIVIIVFSIYKLHNILASIKK